MFLFIFLYIVLLSMFFDEDFAVLDVWMECYGCVFDQIILFEVQLFRGGLIEDVDGIWVRLVDVFEFMQIYGDWLLYGVDWRLDWGEGCGFVVLFECGDECFVLWVELLDD